MSMVLWVSAALSGLLLLLSLIGIVCIWGTFYFFWGGLSLIWLLITLFRIQKKHTIKKPVIYLAGRILLALICLYFLQFTTPIFGGFEIQYPMQKTYLEMHGFRLSHFPEKLPDELHQYAFYSFPSMLQGDPSARIFIETDADTISYYKEICESKAISIYPLEQYNWYYSALDEDEHFYESINDCNVYVFYDNGDPNHHIASYVLIDEKANIIEFVHG